MPVEWATGGGRSSDSGAGSPGQHRVIHTESVIDINLSERCLCIDRGLKVREKVSLLSPIKAPSVGGCSLYNASLAYIL